MQANVRFHLRRKVLRFLGAEMRVLDDGGQLIAFAEAKPLKLREAITVYGDEGRTQPLVRIDARQVIDFGATYDLTDAATGEPLGALRRRGLTSNLAQDSWTLLDPSDREIGTIVEVSAWLGVLRRFVDLVSLLAPQHYTVAVDGQQVGELRRSRHLVRVEYDIAYDPEYLRRVGHKMALSYPVVLSLIEDDKQ